MLTRFAPTPSGYLHDGNAVNALLVSSLAAAWGAGIALRIDDIDAARLRPEYVDDIFETLAWLGIRWQRGPRDPDDFARHHSQRGRLARYRAGLEALRDSDLQVFACACSRADARGAGRRGCASDCAETPRPWVPGESALRVRIPVGASAAVNGIDVPVEPDDVVVWRRDDLPAYHVTSVVDDADLGVTHVVRGEDLRSSTALQCLLAPRLGAPAVAQATYVHHPLLLDAAGGKLSKTGSSAGSDGRPPRDDARLARLRETAAGLAAGLGFDTA